MPEENEVPVPGTGRSEEHDSILTVGEGALLGGLASIILMAGNAVIEMFVFLPFLPFDLFDWITRVLPGGVVTAGIDFLVLLLQSLSVGPTDRIAKSVERGIALIIFLFLGIVLGVVYVVLSRGLSPSPKGLGRNLGIFLGFLFVLIRLTSTQLANYTLIEAIWVMALFLLWGAGVGYLLRRFEQIKLRTDAYDPNRRSFLYWVGGVAFAAALGAIGLGEVLGAEGGQGTSEVPPDVDLSDTSGAAASPNEAELQNRISPAPGTRVEITSNRNFYTIDINANFRPLDEETWRLEIEGLVERPLSLSLSDIRSKPSLSQVITLQCISNRIGGDLTGTTKWTGVRLVDLLEEVGPLPSVRELAIESADGFYESVSMEDMSDERTLLVYEMNDEPLPHAHGYPLRIYIPNRYGMKQPKWITSIRAIDFEGPGYWVDRGWSEEAFVVTTSVIDTNDAPSGLAEGETFPIGGIAYSGARGISRVEVQVDEGEWQEAQLREPPLSPLTWVQWRFDWPVQYGSHSFKVRAYDGSGRVQIQSSRPIRPDGATGIHSQKIRF